MIYNMDGHGVKSRKMRGFRAVRIGGKNVRGCGPVPPADRPRTVKKRVDIILLPWCNSITNKSGKAKRFLRMRSGMDA